MRIELSAAAFYTRSGAPESNDEEQRRSTRSQFIQHLIAPSQHTKSQPTSSVDYLGDWEAANRALLEIGRH